MQAIIVATSSRNKCVIIINEEPEPIRRGANMAIMSYTLPLPTKHVEILLVIVNT